jgi:hypothetical protein
MFRTLDLCASSSKNMVSPTQLGSNRGGAPQKNKSSFRIVMFCSVYLMMEEVHTPSNHSGIQCLLTEHIVTNRCKRKNDTNLTHRIFSKQSGCVNVINTDRVYGGQCTLTSLQTNTKSNILAINEGS